jgi:hypothetical protein
MIPFMPGRYVPEEEEWLRLGPLRRMKESSRLWRTYLLLGGSLDPDPDPQSPFRFSQVPGEMLADRRAGMHHLRRR